MCDIFHIEGLWFPFHSLWPTASVIRKPINQYAENKNQPWVQTLEVQCIPSSLVLVHWRKLLLLDKPSEQTIKNMNSQVNLSAKLHRMMMMMKKLTQTWWTSNLMADCGFVFQTLKPILLPQSISALKKEQARIERTLRNCTWLKKPCLLLDPLWTKLEMLTWTTEICYSRVADANWKCSRGFCCIWADTHTREVFPYQTTKH